MHYRQLILINYVRRIPKNTLFLIPLACVILLICITVLSTPRVYSAPNSNVSNYYPRNDTYSNDPTAPNGSRPIVSGYNGSIPTALAGEVGYAAANNCPRPVAGWSSTYATDYAPGGYYHINCYPLYFLSKGGYEHSADPTPAVRQEGLHEQFSEYEIGTLAQNVNQVTIRVIIKDACKILKDDKGWQDQGYDPSQPVGNDIYADVELVSHGTKSDGSMLKSGPEYGSSRVIDQNVNPTCADHNINGDLAVDIPASDFLVNPRYGSSNIKSVIVSVNKGSSNGKKVFSVKAPTFFYVSYVNLSPFPVSSNINPINDKNTYGQAKPDNWQTYNTLNIGDPRSNYNPQPSNTDGYDYSINYPTNQYSGTYTFAFQPDCTYNEAVNTPNFRGVYLKWDRGKPDSTQPDGIFWKLYDKTSGQYIQDLRPDYSYVGNDHVGSDSTGYNTRYYPGDHSDTYDASTAIQLTFGHSYLWQWFSVDSAHGLTVALPFSELTSTDPQANFFNSTSCPNPKPVGRIQNISQICNDMTLYGFDDSNQSATNVPFEVYNLNRSGDALNPDYKGTFNQSTYNNPASFRTDQNGGNLGAVTLSYRIPDPSGQNNGLKYLYNLRGTGTQIVKFYERIKMNNQWYWVWRVSDGSTPLSQPSNTYDSKGNPTLPADSNIGRDFPRDCNPKMCGGSNPCTAICSVNISGTLADGKVETGNKFHVTVTITNTSPGGYDLPASISGYPLSFNSGGWPGANTGSNYTFAAPQDNNGAVPLGPSGTPADHTTVSFWSDTGPPGGFFGASTAPGGDPNQTTVAGNVVYSTPISGTCSHHVDAYAKFILTAHAYKPLSGLDENPLTIPYETAVESSLPGYPISASTSSNFSKVGGPTLDSHNNDVRDYYSGPRNGFGTQDTLTTGSKPPVAPLNPGDTYCSYIQIDNWNTGYRGPGNSTDIADTKVIPGSDTDSSCTKIVNEPYVHFFGSDVSAGGGFTGISPNCTNTGGINTYTATTGFNNGGTGPPVGSGVQIGALTIGPINGFSSALLRGSSPEGSTGLSFSNTFNVSGTGPGAPGLGGYVGGKHCINDYATKLPNGIAATPTPPNLSVTTATNGDGTVNKGTPVLYTPPTGSTLTISASTIAEATNQAIFIKGNNIHVRITGNIVYNIPATGWGGIERIPSLLIVVVGGDITVDAAVNQLDGIYVSEPDSSNSGGTIHTCTEAAAGDTSLYDNCRHQLLVNGAFVAKHVYLDRSFGTLRNGSAGDYLYNPTGSPVCGDSGSTASDNVNRAYNDCAAEIFNFDPEVYLSQPPITPSRGYDYITSLSPVL